MTDKALLSPTSPNLASIDRFEGTIAVLIQAGQELRRERFTLAPQAKEGDVVDLQTGAVNLAETEALRERVRLARATAMSGNSSPKGHFDL